MDSKQCADLIQMFVELLQEEWQSKYDLLKELHAKDVCELKRENKELRQQLEKLESNRVENPDAESEVSDADLEDLEQLKEDLEDLEDQEEDADAPEPEIIEDVPSLMD